MKRLRITNQGLKIKGCGLVLLFVLLVPNTLSAQYYSTGQTPARQQWRQIKSDSLRMVFPREFERKARETMFYMDSARQSVTYGFRYGPLKTPVVFKTENFYSNGLGMLAPKRIEMVGIPPVDTYATPWLKQLAVHEYRHMVQYSNINRKTVKVLSYIFGEQLSLLSTGPLPFWFLEGDAVMAETQASEFGRGLQPSFTMHYRALGREILSSGNPDKWFAGSYKDYVPSHYELGYQLVGWSQRKYGIYIWDDIAAYSSRYPFFIFTTQLALGKYYDTSTKKLFREAFADLNDLWDSLPETEDTSAPIVEAPRSYTTYSHPLYIDANTVVALKRDLHRHTRFVTIDIPTGTEKHLAYVGAVSSRPVYGNGKLWWTEYRQSALWEQKTDSRIISLDIAAGKTELFRGSRTALFPTLLPDGSLAWAEYNYEGTYSLIWNGGRYDYGPEVSIHGLDYDEVTGKLYAIELSGPGMRVVKIDILSAATPEAVTPYSRITIGALRAGGGKLYFGSIASGRDEAHMLDLASGAQYRLTGSKYGSFDPSPSPDGKNVALTTYSREGYIASVQPSSGAPEVAAGDIPSDIVNPAPAQWGSVNIDAVEFTAQEFEKSSAGKRTRRYGRLLHAFVPHSWTPFYVEPDNIINDFDFNVHAGATLISQSVLGDAESSLGYGYTGEGNSLLRARVSYLGAAPKFEVAATWSNAPQRVYRPENIPAPEDLKDYLYITARAYLPILLANGYVSRWLTPELEYVYKNSMTWIGGSRNEYLKDEQHLNGSLQYSGSVRRASLDLQTRWGYIAKASFIGRPFNDDFSPMWSLYGKIYTPGIVRHHGISLAATYAQVTDQQRFSYTIWNLLPHGYTSFATKKYFAASANYTLPVAYPDWGLSGVFFLKRIWLRAGFDFASYIPSGQDIKQSLASAGARIWSWGGTLYLDIVPFRLPSQSTSTLSLSCYLDRNNKLYFSAGFSVPL